MPGVLEGIKIVDMGHVVAVPSAGAMMADWGAEVIKVEPLPGEFLRTQVSKIRGAERTVKINNYAVNWEVLLLNRNKKGLALDLKNESGRDILYKLIQKSDVFMSNYEMNVLEKFKLDYGTVSHLKPDIVYAVVTGYGTAGPDKEERGFDYSAAWARTGAQHMTGEVGSIPPLPRPGMMDRMVGSHITSGILAALLYRQRTGKGQKIEYSLYHSGVWAMAADIQGNLMGKILLKDDRSQALNPLLNIYRSRDDRWFILVMIQSSALWPSLLRAIEKPELENDPRFNSMEAREHNCRELICILDEVFAQKNLAEWEKRFKEHKCIYGRIQTPAEVITDPQAIVNEFITEVVHPKAGTMKIITTPVKFCQNPAVVKTPAPEVGQHTEEILLDLGYSQDNIARLRNEKTIL
ncbi:MAG: CoA transferase [Chloroflexota bacterium]